MKTKKEVSIVRGLGASEKLQDAEEIQVRLPWKYHGKDLEGFLAIEIERTERGVTIRGERALIIKPEASNTIEILFQNN
jgi:hypothetical protein